MDTIVNEVRAKSALVTDVRGPVPEFAQSYDQYMARAAAVRGRTLLYPYISSGVGNGALIELIQAPLGTLIEEIDGTRLVHADTSVRGEILILLRSHYPATVPTQSISKSMSARSSGSIKNRLRELKAAKLLHGDGKTGYRLTQTGYAAALAEIQQLQAA